MFEQPNYTQIPNLFLDDVMKTMKETELKVCMAVMRQTFGWHKAGDRISISQLMEFTGLSNSGVCDGVKGAIDKGVLTREPSGQGFIYSLTVSTYEKFSQEPMRNSHKQPMRNSHTQKKGIKERKESVLAAQAEPEKNSTENPTAATSVRENEAGVQGDAIPSPSAAAPLPLEPKQPTEQQRKFQLLCNIVGWDYKILTPQQTGQVAQTLGILCKAGYTEEHLKQFHDQVWAKDWRWQQHHSYPSLAQVRAEMGKLKLQQQVAATRTAAAVEQQQTAIPQMLRMQQRKGFYTQ